MVPFCRVDLDTPTLVARVRYSAWIVVPCSRLCRIPCSWLCQIRHHKGQRATLRKIQGTRAAGSYMSCMDRAAWTCALSTQAQNLTAHASTSEGGSMLGCGPETCKVRASSLSMFRTRECYPCSCCVACQLTQTPGLYSQKVELCHRTLPHTQAHLHSQMFHTTEPQPPTPPKPSRTVEYNSVRAVQCNLRNQPTGMSIRLS